MHQQKRILLITGPPGSGKTTALLRTVGLLRSAGFTVGGIATREVRAEGTGAGARVGFEVIDLHSGVKGWLARVGSPPPGPKVGRYSVDLESFESVAVPAVTNAVESCDIVAVDEVGPMELLSQRFRSAVQRAMESGKPLIATVHWRSDDPLVTRLKTGCPEESEIFEVTPERRGVLPDLIARKATQYLRQKGTSSG